MMGAGHRPFVYWLLLPAALFGLTLRLCGAYFESNDDAVLALLLRGETAAAPVSGFQYYLHGLGHFLAGLYGQYPAVPWYGLVLYALLFSALILSVYFLIKNVQSKLPMPLWLLLPVAVLFLGTWAEHIMWFSFVRVAILLAGAALLASVTVAGSAKNNLLLIFCLAGFVLALCLRPRGAFLGIACVLPALWWLVPSTGNKRSFLLKLLLPFAAVLLVFQLFLSFSTSAEEKELRKINRLKSELIEYNRLIAAPKNHADSLAVAAVQNWLLADRETITSGLFARATKPAGAVAFLQTIPQKLPELLKSFARDYFLLLFLQVVLLFQLARSGSGLPNKKQFLAWQILFWVGLLVLGLWLKLPPRVATACITLHLLGALGIFARFAGVKLFRNKAVLAVLLVLCGLQLYKIAHRVSWQKNAQQQHEAFLAQIAQTFSGKTLVTAQLGEHMSSLSPFRNYNFGNNRMLRITGWPTLLPSYPSQLQTLTGKTRFADAVQALAGQEQTLWLLPAHFPTLLEAYFREHYRLTLTFEGQGQFPAGLQGQGYGVYRARLLP